MEYDNVPARKAARLLIEAARKAAKKNSNNPTPQEINVHLQLLFSGVKNEVRKSKYSLFG